MVRQPSRLGRNRDSSATARILDATNQTLNNFGYNAIRMQSIADEVGCSIATIYRRWGSKEELVAAALESRMSAPDLPASGQPSEDLAALLLIIATDIADAGAAQVELFAAARKNPVLFQAVSDSAVSSARDAAQGLLERILGPDSPHVRLLTQLVPGVMLLRVMGSQGNASPQEMTDEAMRLILDLSSP